MENQQGAIGISLTLFLISRAIFFLIVGGGVGVGLVLIVNIRLL